MKEEHDKKKKKNQNQNNLSGRKDLSFTQKARICRYPLYEKKICVQLAYSHLSGKVWDVYDTHNIHIFY